MPVVGPLLFLDDDGIVVLRLEVNVDPYRSDVADLKGAIAALERKMECRFDVMDQRFLWIVGIQFATLFAIIAGIVGIVASYSECAGDRWVAKKALLVSGSVAAAVPES
ncbi:MAG: hypothetical protein ACRD2X_09850 [Vicinamibacteraceae bacterium]